MAEDVLQYSLELYALCLSLLFPLILIIVLLLSRNTHSILYLFLPHSFIYILFGIVCGVVAIAIRGPNDISNLQFDPRVFFLILVPPMILDAGYNLRKKLFFKNFGTICIFAIMGTLITNAIISITYYYLSAYSMLGLHPCTLPMALQYGTMMTDVDPVAALAVLIALDVEPQLLGLILGEGVINDTLCIVIFRQLEGYEGEETAEEGGEGEGGDSGHDNNSHLNTAAAVVTSIFTLLGIIIASALIGFAIALITSFIMRRLKISHHPAIELVIFFCLSYSSYLVAELAEMSGVISLFVCGITLGHYNYYQLSAIAQSTTRHGLHAISHLSDLFIYLDLGVTFVCTLYGSQLGYQWNVGLIMITLAICIAGRLVVTVTIANIANRFRRQQISFHTQILLWMMGIRGAVSFALALNSPPEVRGMWVPSALTVVMVTSVFGGGAANWYVKRTGLVITKGMHEEEGGKKEGHKGGEEESKNDHEEHSTLSHSDSYIPPPPSSLPTDSSFLSPPVDISSSRPSSSLSSSPSPSSSHSPSLSHSRPPPPLRSPPPPPSTFNDYVKWKTRQRDFAGSIDLIGDHPVRNRSRYPNSIGNALPVVMDYEEDGEEEEEDDDDDYQYVSDGEEEHENHGHHHSTKQVSHLSVPPPPSTTPPPLLSPMGNSSSSSSPFNEPLLMNSIDHSTTRGRHNTEDESKWQSNPLLSPPSSSINSDSPHLNSNLRKKNKKSLRAWLRRVDRHYFQPLFGGRHQDEIERPKVKAKKHQVGEDGERAEGHE